MAIFRFSSGDAVAFKLLFSLAILFGLISILVYSRLHMKYIIPLGLDAPIDKFSEARALKHLHVLSKEIDGRQEGRPGLRQAADYIKEQLELTMERANSSLRVYVEESTINGSFNMMFLGHSISFGYRAHINVLMRISSIDALETDASVLVNAHFDSPLGSPGAGDCGSCVASLLELARLVVDSGWVPPKPVIFLFNGAEELFMLGSHGFMTTNKWRDTIGAFINVEASGTGGPDLVCQSGPGSWPSFVYAKAAIYPMAHSAAQDVFSVVPGDTDYRIFAQDYGKIPGLDIIFLLGGYFYHTSYDTMERILPGSIQARGDNLFSVVKAFASSPLLRNASERHSLASAAPEYNDERAIFFDYLAWFMVFYSKNLSLVLHGLPIVIFLLMPIFLCFAKSGRGSYLTTFCGFLKGTFTHCMAILLAIIVPVVFAFLRLVFSSHAMSWYGHPYLAFMTFIPCSLIGLLVPKYASAHFSHSQAVWRASREEHEVGFWGAFGFYAILSLAYLSAGLSGGFLTFLVSASLLLSFIFCRLSNCSDINSLRSVGSYVLPLVPCLLYSVHFGGFLLQFLIEKMGMMGSIQPPLGFYIQDIIVAAMTGVAVGWCLGPLLPAVGHWLARSSIMHFLLHLNVLAMAVSSQFFPYSSEAPKRVVLQHTVLTADATQVLNSTYDFTVVDSNSLAFLFKHVPAAAAELQIGAEFSFETTKEKWLAIYPICTLFSRTLKVPVRHDDILKQYKYFPHLSTYKPQEISDDFIRKVYLEFNLGSLDEVWVSVLNITGPLSSWSFADEKIPEPDTIDGGPLSYICRLSGSSTENWTFWLEANSSEALRVDVAVLDQRRIESTERLIAKFPDWVDVTAYTSYMSTHFF